MKVVVVKTNVCVCTTPDVDNAEDFEVLRREMYDHAKRFSERFGVDMAVLTDDEIVVDKILFGH